MNLIKLSIVTVVLNDSVGLRKTINSVIRQSYTNFELIVIDGSSNDDTLNVIQEFEARIDHWVSEKDDGIYHAMNKGIRLASGEFVNFLNAGDEFCNDKVLEDIFLKSVFCEYDMIYGGVFVTIGDGSEVELKPKTFSLFNLLFWNTRIICHQSIFVNAKIVALYSQKYILKDELNWYFDILKACNAYFVLDFPVVRYSPGGFSERHYWVNFRESLTIIFSRHKMVGVVSIPIIVYQLFRNFLNDKFHNDGKR